MPHTTRRRPKHSIKHHHFTTSDGWTHVFRGTSAQKHAPHPPLSTVLSPTEISDDVTLAKAHETHTKYTRRWRESEWCAKLVTVLEREVVPGVVGEGAGPGGGRLDNCVVLGLGSLTGGEGREHSWWQLVALETILEVLRSQNHEMADIAFQDPRFNALDTEFLASLSYTTVPDPSAFSSIGPMTFVYIPHGELDVTARALEPEGLALYIGNDLDMWIENPTIDEGKKVLVKRWREGSVSVGMPRAEGSGWCNNTRIYWKRHEEKEGAED